MEQNNNRKQTTLMVSPERNLELINQAKTDKKVLKQLKKIANKICPDNIDTDRLKDEMNPQLFIKYRWFGLDLQGLAQSMHRLHKAGKILTNLHETENINSVYYIPSVF